IRALQDNPHRVVDKPDLINRLIFRYVAVYLMREQMLALPQRLSFIDLGSWGPGRNDTFGADKAFFRFPMAHADPSEATGNTDFFPVDAALAARGEPIYAHYCASCHGTKDPPFRHLPPLPAEHVGEVTPIAVIGTDRHRLDSFTRELSVNLATNYAGFEKDWG